MLLTLSLLFEDSRSYGVKNKKQQKPTPIQYIYNSTECTFSTKGEGTPMPCVYTQWVDAHRCLHLNTIVILRISKSQKKT